MLDDLLSAFALVFVIEGILPFAFPDAWRGVMRQAASLDDRSLRSVGAVSMFLGLMLLYLVR